MKIKHWQGYGSVNAKKLSKSTKGGITTLKVEVSGNHEYGVVRDDIYDLKRWLVDRFDKTAPDCYDIGYSYENGYRRNGSIDEEYCIYTFTWRN